jgi:hypothetical protein
MRDRGLVLALALLVVGCEPTPNASSLPLPSSPPAADASASAVVDPTAVATATRPPTAVPTAAPTPTAVPAASSAVAPTPESTPPADLSTTFSKTGLGVKVTVKLDRNPMPAGEPTWLTTTVKNVTDHDISWFHDGCDTTTWVSGELTGAAWRPGVAVTDPKSFKGRLLARELAAPLRIAFAPERFVGVGRISCADLGTEETIKPGRWIAQRARWDGLVDLRLGSPLSGPVKLTFFSEYFWSKGHEPENIPAQRIEFGGAAWIVDGRDPGWLDPPEVVDAALADPAFARWVESKPLGNGVNEILWFDAKRGLWQVGTLEYEPMRLHYLLIDPLDGSVVETVERAWVPDTDGFP